MIATPLRTGLGLCALALAALPASADTIYLLDGTSIDDVSVREETFTEVEYKDGSTYSGTRAIADYWRSKGVSVDGLHMKDGSGLSRYNGVTPDQLCSMMRVNHSQKYFQSFYNSLPIAGLSTDPGTLRRMCRNTAAANNVRAKSGYISRVRAYTGFVDSKSGKRYCFAMMANNYTCSNREMRDLFEALMVAMAEMP